MQEKKLPKYARGVGKDCKSTKFRLFPTLSTAGASDPRIEIPACASRENETVDKDSHKPRLRLKDNIPTK